MSRVPVPADPGAHAVFAMAMTLCALLLYMRSTVRVEYSSAAILFVLVFAFEVSPYRGPPVITDTVEDVAREVSPSVTDEVAPDSGAPIAEPEPIREVLLRGSEFFRGFGNEALITICLLLVLAKGVERSGALRPLGRLLARLWDVNRQAALLVTILFSAVLSAFVNNTPVVVMMISLVAAVSTTTGVATSRVLMPAGFAAILGGMCTTIGTSTNLLVASISERLGGPAFALLSRPLPRRRGSPPR
jgi:di/tricarboxylate transporter